MYKKEVNSYWLDGEDIQVLRHELQNWSAYIDKEKGKWRIDNVRPESPVFNLFKMLKIYMSVIRE